MTENVAFLTDFDPNLTVFDMDEWPYAVVDNFWRCRKIHYKQQAEGRRKPGDTCFRKVSREKELRVRSAECGVKNCTKATPAISRKGHRRAGRGTRGERTAKMADGGLRPGIGIRESGFGNGGTTDAKAGSEEVVEFPGTAAIMETGR